MTPVPTDPEVVILVHWETVPGTARADMLDTRTGLDYTGQSGTQGFGNNGSYDPTHTVWVPINDDGYDEGDETFGLRIGLGWSAERPDLVFPPSAPARVKRLKLGFGAQEATVTIADNDSNPSVTLRDAGGGLGGVLSEGRDAVQEFDVRLVSATPVNSTKTVRYRVRGLTDAEAATTGYVKATPGVDFIARTGTVTFGVGETLKTVTLGIPYTPELEPDEAFVVELYSPGSGLDIVDGQAFYQIADGPPPSNGSAAGVLSGFTLVDASDQATVASLTGGAKVDLGARLGGSFGIRADIKGGSSVGSVLMSLEGLQIASATENMAPYSLYGDYRNGRDVRDLRGGPLPPGPYTITATAYSKKRGTGTVVGTLAVSFEALVPPALSVADARAEEGVDAALDFAVTLNRASVGTVTVDYATGYGTASRGRDYIAKSGTLTFAAGETEKTVSVTVLDDALDEGNEWVALRLSNPSGATIADSEAVGRISNDGPIPQAWLARFGRTVTGQVLDAVEARLAAPGAPGAKASLAGQALPSWRGGTAAADDDAARQRREDREAGAALASMTAWLAQMDPDAGVMSGAGDEPGTRAPTRRDFIAGTSFALTGGSAEGGGFASLWGQGSIAGFDGREGSVTLDGEVATGLIGADWASARWTAGLALGHSTGTGDYGRGGGCDVNCGGAIEATLSGLYPYAGLDLTERLSAWAAAGHGAGEVTVTPEGEVGMTADLTMSMAAAGLRSEVLTPGGENGLALAVKGDARFTRTSSDAVSGEGGNLAAADADVWLVRFGLEGSRRFALGNGKDGASVTPSFELGVRRDGGDAETGLGADFGAGVSFADRENGLNLDLEGRALVAHEADRFREWGASAAFGWDPQPATGRGLALSLRQSWGASSSGGMDALLSRETLAGLAANDDGAGRFEASRRLEGEVGYGLPAFGGGFTGTPNLGVGLSEGAREYRLGWRLTPARSGDPGFAVSLDATRREPANPGSGSGAGSKPEHGVMLRGSVRW